LAGREDLVLVVAERRTAYCLVVGDEAVELRQGRSGSGRSSRPSIGCITDALPINAGSGTRATESQS
jgi:hypothetical protein